MDEKLDEEQISDFLETHLLDQYDQEFMMALMSTEHKVTGLIVRSSQAAQEEGLEYETMTEYQRSEFLNALSEHDEIIKIRTSPLIDFYDENHGFRKLFRDFTASGEYETIQYNRLPSIVLMDLQ